MPAPSPLILPHSERRQFSRSESPLVAPKLLRPRQPPLPTNRFPVRSRGLFRKMRGPLLLGSGRGFALHMLLHARFPVGFKLLHLGLLIRRQQLVELVVDAGLFHLELNQSLRLLSHQSLYFGFVVCALGILFELIVEG